MGRGGPTSQSAHIGAPTRDPIIQWLVYEILTLKILVRFQVGSRPPLSSGVERGTVEGRSSNIEFPMSLVRIRQRRYTVAIKSNLNTIQITTIRMRGNHTFVLTARPCSKVVLRFSCKEEIRGSIPRWGTPFRKGPVVLSKSSTGPLYQLVR